MTLDQVDEVDFLVQFDRILRISLPVVNVSLEELKQSISSRIKVPANRLDLYENGNRLHQLELSAESQYQENDSSLRMLRVRMTGGLLGGKGGFGAMLRSMGKAAGSKATTDFGACRDLNGRRLRHVNQEIQLKKWLQAKETKEAKRRLGQADDDDEDEDQQEITPSGIPNWYLATPSWAEGIQPPSSHLKRRRNTVLCKYWLAARAPDSKNPPPPNAPRWYGCPRGRNCDFAHGEEELRGKALNQWKRQKKEQVALEKQQAKAKYLDFEQQTKQEDLLQAIRQGIRRQQGIAKPTNDQEVTKEEEDEGEVEQEGDEEEQDDAPVQWLQVVTDDHEESASAGIHMMTNGVYEVVGMGNFGTVQVCNCNLLKGKWNFEIFLKQSSGIIQVGWADGSFSTNSATGDGVGDHARSWAYDGLRQIKLHDGKEEEYGAKWRQGDVVSCLLDLDSGTIGFGLNGKQLGVAFRNIAFQQERTGFFPVISLEKDENVAVNIGTRAFQYPIKGYEPVFKALQPDAGVFQPKQEIKRSDDKVESKGAEWQLPQGDRKQKANVKEPSQPVELVNLLQVGQAEELHELGMDRLKEQLQARGLKCGGTLEERAARLFSVRGKSWNEIDTKLKAKGAK